MDNDVGLQMIVLPHDGQIELVQVLRWKTRID